MKTKKDKHYIPILDQPIEELKKPIGEKVDFNAVMKKALSYNVKIKVARNSHPSNHLFVAWMSSSFSE